MEIAGCLLELQDYLSSILKLVCCRSKDPAGCISGGATVVTYQHYQNLNQIQLKI
jgi:hypothetical protein